MHMILAAGVKQMLHVCGKDWLQSADSFGNCCSLTLAVVCMHLCVAGLVHGAAPSMIGAVELWVCCQQSFAGPLTGWALIQHLGTCAAHH